MPSTGRARGRRRAESRLDVPQGGGTLERIDRFGRRIEDALLAVLLVGLVLLASSQIVLRNVFSIGLAWADGLVRLGVLWLALLGAVAASRDQKHIAIDVVTRLLTPRGQVVAAVVRNAFTTVVCALLAWYSWVFVRDSREFGDTLLGDWPAWWLQIVMPIGFGLIALRYAILTVRTIR